ncbi:WUSCHEL-related homeobox 11-like [Dendrobium catenatum]|uniref:WUSCHEL-related homeobox 11-like n=1 Tax=Dendrobium catenatum TaxID=906689 RepID=UPI0010A04114|nr:WUSCHEL-related homeobox 11-like [Dendrobium catenatum]
MDNNKPPESTASTINPCTSESPASGTAVSDPIRSRWTPKPEQILILESIFNSGMVNPPREETVRIRKLLEKFGSVGDANVFYWFQNRRSRSRRRQRQLQASLAATTSGAQAGVATSASCSSSSLDASSLASSFGSSSSSSSSSSSASVGSVWCESADDLFSISQQMGFGEMKMTTKLCMIFCNTKLTTQNYNAGTVNVFINGILTEVPRGPIDMRSMFGHDLLMVHSSGEVLPVNEYGVLLQSLQMGESYYLV